MTNQQESAAESPLLLLIPSFLPFLFRSAVFRCIAGYSGAGVSLFFFFLLLSFFLPSYHTTTLCTYFVFYTHICTLCSVSLGIGGYSASLPFLWHVGIHIDGHSEVLLRGWHRSDETATLPNWPSGHDPGAFAPGTATSSPLICCFQCQCRFLAYLDPFRHPISAGIECLAC